MTPCILCKVKEADERSDLDMCMKCHFDMTEVVLVEEDPSGQCKECGEYDDLSYGVCWACIKQQNGMEDPL